MIIRDSILSKKYAKAFLNIFFADINLEFINKLSVLVQQLKHNHKAKAYMQMVSISDQEKKKVITKMLSSFGLDNNLDKLIDILIKNKRLYLLFLILEQIEQKYKERENIIDITFKSANELDEKERKVIEDFFAKKVGKKVFYKYLIDKNLIAGVKLIGDNYLWEYSLAQKLNSIKERL
ncbi:ATP synthase F1 subunit delta [Candidatus Dependentiae bacterium]|nr:ATP synthase F1 subunit delta [Candidatus Dependentiae bacterium]